LDLVWPAEYAKCGAFLQQVALFLGSHEKWRQALKTLRRVMFYFQDSITDNGPEWLSGFEQREKLAVGFPVLLYFCIIYMYCIFTFSLFAPLIGGHFYSDRILSSNLGKWLVDDEIALHFNTNRPLMK
jgi:hypothetical protein